MSIALARAVPIHVLLTDFEPFGGSPRNGSQLVSKELKNLPPGDIVYTVCTLPVVYDKAPAVALNCIDKMNPKPDIVLSLGQGDCDTRIEAEGYNKESGFGPDNAGNSPNKNIDDNGPADEMVALPVGEMYCALPPTTGHRRDVALSMDPGFFVCNDVIFSLATKLKARKIPTGFLHVPAFDGMSGFCGGIADPKAVAASIHKMVRVAARSLKLLPNPAEVARDCDISRGSGFGMSLKGVDKALHEQCLLAAENELFNRGVEQARSAHWTSMYETFEDAMNKTKAESLKPADIFLQDYASSKYRYYQFDKVTRSLKEKAREANPSERWLFDLPVAWPEK